jgi:hypothetical protein
MLVSYHADDCRRGNPTRVDTRNGLRYSGGARSKPACFPSQPRLAPDWICVLPKSRTPSVGAGRGAGCSGAPRVKFARVGIQQLPQLVAATTAFRGALSRWMLDRIVSSAPRSAAVGSDEEDRPQERERRAPPTNSACFPRCPDGHRRVPTGRGAATFCMPETFPAITAPDRGGPRGSSA